MDPAEPREDGNEAPRAMSYFMTPAEVVELREAAHDYASLIQIERFHRDDIAVKRAYERLRKALETGM